MKHFFLSLAILFTTTLAQANMSELKKLVPTGKLKGSSGNKVTCTVETQWISETEFSVKASTNFYDLERKHAVYMTFSAKNKYTVNDLMVEQTIPYVDGDGKEMYRHESFELITDENGKLEAISTLITEEDFVSDGRELFSSYCEVSTK